MNFPLWKKERGPSEDKQKNCQAALRTQMELGSQL